MNLLDDDDNNRPNNNYANYPLDFHSLHFTKMQGMKMQGIICVILIRSIMILPTSPIEGAIKTEVHGVDTYRQPIGWQCVVRCLER